MRGGRPKYARAITLDMVTFDKGRRSMQTLVGRYFGFQPAARYPGAHRIYVGTSTGGLLRHLT
jgi:hypothetical protein